MSSQWKNGESPESFHITKEKALSYCIAVQYLLNSLFLHFIFFNFRFQRDVLRAKDDFHGKHGLEKVLSAAALVMDIFHLHPVFFMEYKR